MRSGGFLDGIDLFDHRLFGMSSREAKSVDPQQRLLLEATWHCLEDAGLTAAQLARAVTGVFAGVMAIDYQQNLTGPDALPDGYACLGSYAALLANRVSHTFGWSGPSCTVDAACASSLVALHQARRALLAGECDYAVVGAANAILNPWRSISFSQARMLSPNGLCRTFDRDADGYVPGEGVVVLLLRRLEDAQRDGDRIHGHVLGSAVNHVGSSRTITAPSVASQSAVIRRAATEAGIRLDSVSYVEAHGTGTALGDPIEIEALTRAFRQDTDRIGFCRVGSVKTNIGHLEAAAGLAGIVKVLLMMRHGRIVPTLNLENPNPLLDFTTGPFVPACGGGVGRLTTPGGRELLRVWRCQRSRHSRGTAAGPRKTGKGVTAWRPGLFLLSAGSAASLEAPRRAWRDLAQLRQVASLPFQDRVPDADARTAGARPSLGRGRRQRGRAREAFAVRPCRGWRGSSRSGEGRAALRSAGLAR